MSVTRAQRSSDTLSRPWTMRAPRALALIAAVLAWIWVLYEQGTGQRSLHDTFVIGGVLLFAAALLVPRGPAAATPARRDILAIFVFTAAGVLPRALFFDQYPPADGQLWEESQLGMIAVDSIRHNALDPYFPLPNLLAESAFRLFEVSLTTLRIPFVIAGIAAVPVFFLAVRALGVGTLACWAATALFASSAYLAASSRIAFEPQSPVLTMCAALATSLRAVRQPTPGWMALAGFFAGLLMTEYTCYKIYPPFLFAMLVMAAFSHQEGIRPRAATGRIALFAAFAVAVMAPLFLLPGAIYVQVEGILRHRHALPTASPLSWEAITAAADRVAVSAAQIFLRGSSNDVLPDTTGVLDVYTGVLGSAALVYCAYLGRRSPPALFLVVSVVATVVLAGVLTGNPARYRLTGLPPLYFLAIALAIDAIIRRWPSRPVRVGIVGAVAVSCAINLYLLFGVTLHHPRVHAEFGDRAMALALEIADLQKRYPGPVLLDTPETYLTVENDYAFIYDLERIRMVRQRADLDDMDGYLLTDTARADEIRRLPSIGECTTTTYEYGPLLSFSFLVCENRSSAQRSLDEGPLA